MKYVKTYENFLNEGNSRLEEVKPNDKSTSVLLEYNRLLNTDPRVESVLLPIRDGLTVSRVL
jgi:predicted O-methyltransferase YrrM